MYISKDEVNLNVKEFFERINENNFKEARISLSKIPATSNKLKEQIIFLSNYLREKEEYFLNKNEIDSYLERANSALTNDKSYLKAINIYNEGFKETGNKLFLYYIANTYYSKGDLENTIMFLRKYTKYSYMFLCEGYYLLFKCYQDKINNHYETLDFKENKNLKIKLKKQKVYENEFLYKYLKIKLIKDANLFSNPSDKMDKRTKDINLDDKEVENIIKSGKLNDVSIIYDISGYERKITIIALLYINGFEEFANKLLKQEKDDIKNECPLLYKQLQKNKKLYLNKAKFNK